jgi:hypothetical protein
MPINSRKTKLGKRWLAKEYLIEKNAENTVL